jgi:signal transduction histidine kinase
LDGDGIAVLTWWRRRSLRARVTLLATTIFVVAFTIAILLAAVALTNSLTRALDRSAVRTGEEIAALVNSDRLPEQLLAGSGGVFLVQVVDGNDRVLAASPTADAIIPMLRPDELARARDGATITIPAGRVSDSPVRTIAVKAGTEQAPRTVIVGADIGRLQDSAEITREIGLYSIPVMGALMALLTYFIVGVALRGVSALRRGADEITATGRIDSRLPVPHSRDEAYRLAVTLNAMLDRLESSTEGQRRFVGDAAHELRSPIASLRTQFEVASMLGPDNDWSELIADAMVDLDRLSRLVEDLLALARSDEASGTLRRTQPVDLADLAESAAAAYSAARVPVDYLSPDQNGPVPPINGEPDALHRVLVNLIDNAVRHATTQVSVTVAATGGVVELTVADDGPGIPQSQREKVFDRFVRLDSARARDTGGTGLGLAIVKEIVTAHGGSIMLADNRPGLRAVVRFPLPAPAGGPRRRG